MNSLLRKIPLLRSFIRNYNKLKFNNEWRRLNPHNETIVGERYFPMEVVSVGKASYGMLNIQSLYVTAAEKLIIGNYVSIAPGVTFLLGVNHQTETVSTFPLYSKLVQRSPVDAISKGPIVVSDEVWIGTDAKIFSGITIGKGAIIAAGAIVTKDVPPYAIVGGNPAKIIRYKFAPEILQIILPINLIDFPDSWLKENIEEFYKKIETVEDALHLKRLTDTFKLQK